jgi:hypothetical protein
MCAAGLGCGERVGRGFGRVSAGFRRGFGRVSIDLFPCSALFNLFKNGMNNRGVKKCPEIMGLGRFGYNHPNGG